MAVLILGGRIVAGCPERPELGQANAAARIKVEGHADERGTNEYNLGSGDRRAKATKDYLVAAGIDTTGIATMSYGEERPFVLGHDDRAWKWNRRARFVLMAQ